MKIIVFLLMGVLLIFKYCGDDTPQPSDGFVLKVNEKYDAGSFELLLTGIGDSRCPKDVECVWAGNAITSLLVQPASGDDTLKLCIGLCNQAGGGATDTLTTAGGDYALTLLEVNPYPGTGSGREKEARFSLEPLP